MFVVVKLTHDLIILVTEPGNAPQNCGYHHGELYSLANSPRASCACSDRRATPTPATCSRSLRFRLTGGQEHDVTQAEALISDMDSEYVIADRAYDSRQFRESIIGNGTTPGDPASLEPKGVALIR